MALPKKIKCFKYLVYSYVVLLAVSCIGICPSERGHKYMLVKLHKITLHEHVYLYAWAWRFQNVRFFNEIFKKSISILFFSWQTELIHSRKYVKSIRQVMYFCSCRQHYWYIFPSAFLHPFVYNVHTLCVHKSYIADRI